LIPPLGELPDRPHTDRLSLTVMAMVSMNAH